MKRIRFFSIMQLSVFLTFTPMTNVAFAQDRRSFDPSLKGVMGLRGLFIPLGKKIKIVGSFIEQRHAAWKSGTRDANPLTLREQRVVNDFVIKDTQRFWNQVSKEMIKEDLWPDSFTNKNGYAERFKYNPNVKSQISMGHEMLPSKGVAEARRSSLNKESPPSAPPKTKPKPSQVTQNLAYAMPRPKLSGELEGRMQKFQGLHSFSNAHFLRKLSKHFDGNFHEVVLPGDAWTRMRQIVLQPHYAALFGGELGKITGDIIRSIAKVEHFNGARSIFYSHLNQMDAQQGKATALINTSAIFASSGKSVGECWLWEAAERMK